MKRFTLPQYIATGLLFWGVPGVFVLGPQALIITTLAVIPLIAVKPARFEQTGLLTPSRAATLLFASGLLLYLICDALWGRQKFAANLFFDDLATDAFVEVANAMVSRGRGFIELLGAMLITAPFLIIDFSKKIDRRASFMVLLVALIFILYDIGIGRAYLLMAVISISFGVTSNLRYRIWGIGFALFAFVAASLARGAIDEFTFLRPIEDGIVWPFKNLELMTYSYCGYARTTDFLFEFFKKFAPSFLIEKNIFSFNIEMTNCIYPSSVYNFESISIFTWLGEMVYYKPPFATALLSGGVLAVLAALLEKQFVQMHLVTTRYFVGLLCITLLRSRILDVITLLILTWVLLFCVAFWLRQRPAKL